MTGILPGRKVAILARVDCLLVPYLCGGEMGRVPSGVTGDDAGIVGRVALSLMSACRPPFEQLLKYDVGCLL